MVKKKNYSSYEKLGREAFLPQEDILAIDQNRKQITIGIPKETNEFENRIALVPQSVELLTYHGHKVIIERGAGEGANFSNHDYSEVGATIVDDVEAVLSCDIIIKISPPSVDELKKMGNNKIILSTFHAQIQNQETLKMLKQKRISAIGFEYIQNNETVYPFVRSMSEIAGSASVIIASEYLSSANKGMGKMLGGITGVNPTEVIILGAGTVGEQAARAAIGLGATVKIFDDSIDKLRAIRSKIGFNVYTSVLQPIVLANALKTVDVVISAKWITEGTRQIYISEELVKIMKKGSVIVDVSIDKGGCVETSKLTTHGKPTFVKHGVIHYCVPNIASRFARTASYALSNQVEKIIIDISQYDTFDNVLRSNTSIRNGIYFYQGILTKESIANLFNWPYKDIDLLFAAY